MKVSVEGGSAVKLGDSPYLSLGASWGDDGNIILSSSSGLWRIPETEGWRSAYRQN
jgi:hypothetical protein